MPADPAAQAAAPVLATRPQAIARTGGAAQRARLVSVIVVLLAAVAAYSLWGGIAAVGAGAIRVLWVVPALMTLHLGQLLLAALSWRALFSGTRRQCAETYPGVLAFWRLRVVREGIDSVLPVAQVGGEIVGARLLSRRGVTPSRAAASVVVDLTVELLTQVLFLLAGLSGLAWLAGGIGMGVLPEMVVVAAAIATGLLLAQRFGLLHALETLIGRIACRWPSLLGAPLDGLHAEALRFYRAPAGMLWCIGLHIVGWSLGTVESWVVLHLLGVPVTVPQAFVVESLGMAARSAGFVIPGAIGVQEGGFVLAALALGLPAGPALALSLIKRVREIAVGVIGLVLWRAPSGERT